MCLFIPSCLYPLMLLASSHSILPLLERKKMEKTPRIDLLYLPTHKLLEETPWRYHDHVLNHISISCFSRLLLVTTCRLTSSLPQVILSRSNKRPDSISTACFRTLVHKSAYPLCVNLINRILTCCQDYVRPLLCLSLDYFVSRHFHHSFIIMA